MKRNINSSSQNGDMTILPSPGPDKSQGSVHAASPVRLKGEKTLTPWFKRFLQNYHVKKGLAAASASGPRLTCLTLGSAAFHAALMATVRKFFITSSRHYRNLSAHERTRFDTYVVSLFNATWVSAFSAIYFHELQKEKPNLTHMDVILSSLQKDQPPPSERFQRGSLVAMASMLGYFINDFIVGLPHIRMYPEEAVHHTIGFFMLGSELYRQNPSSEVPILGLVEISTVLYDLHYILKVLKPESRERYGQGHFLYRSLLYGFGGAFAYFRVYLFGRILLEMHRRDREEDANCRYDLPPSISRYVLKGSLFTAYTLQLFWFTKIVRLMLKF